MGAPSLGSVRQKLVDGLARLSFELVTVGSFLTPDAELRPRDGIQSLGFDFPFAVQADPLASVSKTFQGSQHLAKQVGY
jgi:hypothetical protein